MKDETKLSELIGKTLKEVKQEHNGEVLRFICDDGTQYAQYSYEANCGNDVCVNISDIAGDIKDLIGSPILVAEERSSYQKDGAIKEPEAYSTHTWTFYEFATIKGSVTFRWCGESNGYYSEKVDFFREI